MNFEIILLYFVQITKRKKKLNVFFLKITLRYYNGNFSVRVEKTQVRINVFIYFSFSFFVLVLSNLNGY